MHADAGMLIASACRLLSVPQCCCDLALSVDCLGQCEQRLALVATQTAVLPVCQSPLCESG